MPSENVLGGRSQQLILGIYAMAVLVAVTSAVESWRPTGIVAVAVAVGADALLGRELRTLLRKAGHVYVARFALRSAIVLTMLPTSPFFFWDDDDAATGVSFGIGTPNYTWVLVAVVAYASAVGLRDLMINVRDLGVAKPALTRNMGLRPAPTTHPLADAVRGGAELLIFLPALLEADLPVVAALALVAIASQLLPAVGTTREVYAALRARGQGRPKPATAQLQGFLDVYRPEVVLYLSGQAETAYQVDVWLTTMERLDQRVLILLRKKALFESIAATSLPVACVQNATDVIALDFSSVRVGLYPAHVGDNIHLLRLPHVRSAFIGHGDSDKSGSASPFSRVYEQVWVAGQAGIDRYAEGGIDIDPHRFVVVGRPQIAAISTTRPDEPRPTVLYAPTWEAWADEGSYSSLLSSGRTIVRALVDAGCRVVYKPHPMTGIRDPRFVAAHLHIVAELHSQGGVSVPVAGDNPADALSAVEREVADRERYAAAWRAAGDAHVVVDAGGPDIVSCFNASHALVTDVSSVVSDYLASEKPYAVFNARRTTPDAFVAEFPTASAATVFDDAEQLAAFVAVVTGEAPDTLRPARHALADHTLGVDRTLAPFQRAVTDLASRN